jgi:hypothetical protein
MSHLKFGNMEKCVSLLREFIEDAPSMTGKKEIAVLALNQLQRISAGSDNTTNYLIPGCTGRPIINES